MKTVGVVHLVGAGPGDPGLLTLRGRELLEQADVVVYDGLVNTDLLRFANPRAKVIYGGKHDRSRAMTQEVLTELLITQARLGKRVVRLKGGDPYVLGRGGEEAMRLAEAGVPFEVVSGVSSAQAVLNYAGIPLTHRDYCSSFTVITGHEDPTRPESRLDWARLAQAPGTLVILMGLTHLREISRLLLEHGRAPTTPAALIRWGTTGRQKVVTGTLSSIADRAELARLQPPVTIVVGDVVSLRDRLNWFEKGTLFGQRIVVTQPWPQAGELADLLQRRGADVLGVMSETEAAAGARVRFLEEGADWIVFSSILDLQNFRQRFDLGQLARQFPKMKFATLEPGTRDRLEALGLTASVEAPAPTAEALVQALEKAGD